MDPQFFVYQQFAEFYKEGVKNIKAPLSIQQREFGFIIFKDNIMVRHKRFKTVDSLRSFVKRTAPAHAFYSTAYYEVPEEKMENKGWLGADLYFDIDADHIPTDCSKIHDTWTCRTCDFSGKGYKPKRCPSCNDIRFKEKTWPCEICLESTKTEMVKLLDMLTSDFGFSPDEVNISFSGHRGYHVHLKNDGILKLDSVGRKEITDYITGIGLDPSLHQEPIGAKLLNSSNHNLKKSGWRGRIVSGTYNFLLTASEDDLKSLGLKKKTIKKFISNKEAILKICMRKGSLPQISGMSKEGLDAVIKYAVKNESANIDTVVTTDIHRLIRLPNSLHGKTGWLKTSLPIVNIESFDPLKRSIAFKKGEATVFVEESPKFRIGEELFGPFKQQKVELPLAATVFLLCKGVAKVVD